MATLPVSLLNVAPFIVERRNPITSSRFAHCETIIILSLPFSKISLTHCMNQCWMATYLT
ncbi:hypothetical protein PUN28_000944 [Cardiocondyla obscurior]|uniref:Uncharacterized protein n=1 Tax=Cardiocondyla obscurior TaxID=286306 RepID=A0AAW2H1W1_9HYME